MSRRAIPRLREGKLWPCQARRTSYFWTAPNVTILRQTGVGTRHTCPAGVSVPVSGSIRKVTIVPLSRLAASRNVPDASIAKLRGFLPCVYSWPTGCRVPVSPMTKAAMLLCPRFEP